MTRLDFEPLFVLEDFLSVCMSVQVHGAYAILKLNKKRRRRGAAWSGAGFFMVLCFFVIMERVSTMDLDQTIMTQETY